MSNPTKLFSCKYKDIELNCLQGNIVMAETDCIAFACDPEFHLSTGIGRAVRCAAGPQFMDDLRFARSQQSSIAISVPITTTGVQANVALLAPVRRADRRALDQIYIALIQKAIELRVESVTMPVLGTGGLDLSFDVATGFLRLAMTHFINFGDRLKKLNFIDTGEEMMRQLRRFIIDQLMYTRQPNGSAVFGASSTRPTTSNNLNTSFRAIGSGTADSPVELFHRPAAAASNTRRAEPSTSGSDGPSSSTATATPGPSTSRRRARRPALPQINGTQSDNTLDSQQDSSSSTSLSSYNSDAALPDLTEDELEVDSTVSISSNEGDRDGHNDHPMDADDDDDSDADSSDMNMDLSDIMDSDDTLATDDEDSTDEDSSDDDDMLLATENEDAGAEGAGGNNKKVLSKEQEERFWTVVPVEQLTGGSNTQNSDKPSTSAAAVLTSKSGRVVSGRKSNSQLNSSKSSAKDPNVQLDDTTMPCSICLSDMRESEADGDEVVQLALCSHMFHKDCIKSAFKVKPQCPLCMLWYGEFIGYQPANAIMNVQLVSGHVPGHRNAKGFIQITYHVPAGIQTQGHIRPGEPYRSATRIAFLPNNTEGNQVLKLLQLAFKRRLIFTIGDSITSGRKNVPVWNNIHHKTNKDGGPQSYGYPDPGYLERVKEELAMVGVRSDQV